MSYNITYNYAPNTTVWIEERGGFFECKVDKVLILIAPDATNVTTMETLYSLRPKDCNKELRLREESLVFPSSSDVIQYMLNGTIPSVSSTSLTHEYAVGDNVWVKNEDDVIINGNIIQIEIQIRSSGTNIFYRVLPISESYSATLFPESELFTTAANMPA